MTYAFSFDASACSGCKACQEACKDKNNLPAGVLWRRVIEVTGGGWHVAGSAWDNNVFAYNLSLACSHCTHPKCAGVCPTNAYTVRPDGIVLLNSSLCMGCGYCAWACPYGAPQYNPDQGIMTKCDFCFDRLDVGQPPACVAACPLRVLNSGLMEEPLVEGLKALWQIPPSEHPFPLPEYSRTQPHLAIKQHAGMGSPLEKTVSNREEIKPPQPGKIFAGPALNEPPLVVFTLSIQMAVGMVVGMLAVPIIPLPLLLAIGLLLAVAGLSSFLHLGRKRNAWRALSNLKKSWLSREAGLTIFFGAAWALSICLKWFHQDSPVGWLLGFLGCYLLYSMSQIYRLKAVPSWNTWRTLTAFILSAVTLGSLGLNLFVPSIHWKILASLALLAELILVLQGQSFETGGKSRLLRIILLGLGILGTLFLAFLPMYNGTWLNVVVLLIILAEEVIDRERFYSKPLLGRI
jgi:anaerobic dimethyl sulfoxide reductase subunit B